MKRVALAGLLALGCSVGQGTGEVKGPLTIEDCGGPGVVFPDPENPQEYDLHAAFFAAEQLLDLNQGQTKSHRLIIRLQNTGRRREANDILRFDIPNLFEVARCIRAAGADAGADDYDHRECAPGPGGTRIRVGPTALIRAFITPNYKCSTKVQLYPHVGTAISTVKTPPDGNWESWIVFSELGSVRDSDFGFDFKIDIDDRLEADFALAIEDDAVVTAKSDPLMPPIPRSHIHGNLTGSFHFDMQRGQGAQTFP
jgi:hypothetical protein